MSNTANRHVPSLQEQFAQRRLRRKRKHVQLRSSNEEQDHHNHTHSSEALFHEEDLEQRNGDEMQIDGEKDHVSKDNQLAQQNGTKTNHETTTFESSHQDASLVVDSITREPSSYEALQKQQEKSQNASVATTQPQYEVHREQQELETMREVCQRLLDQLKTREAELQIQTKKYSDLKEKYYKWYHCFLKVWADKFHKNETEEPPPGIPMSPRDSNDQHPVFVTPSPWPNPTESTSTTSMEPKRLSACLQDRKETTGTSAKSTDLLAREHRVDSSTEADESNDAGSVTQFGGLLPEMRNSSPVSASKAPRGPSASLCKVDNKETISHGTANGSIGGGDKKTSHVDSPLESEESHDAGSETQLNGPLPVKRRSSPPNEPMKSKRLSVSLRETDSKTTMTRGTLKEINDYWEKKMLRVNTPVQADDLNDAESETQLNGPTPAMRSTSPPNTTIEPNRLSSNEPMIRATSNGGFGVSDNKRSRVGSSPIEADTSDDVGSQTRLSGPSCERRSCSPTNKTLEPKRLSTSFRESDSKETMPRGRSKKAVNSDHRKASRVDSPIQAGDLNDASGETQLSDPSPAERSKSPASKSVEPKWLTASLRERSHKEAMNRGNVKKKTADSRDNVSPIKFDGSNDAESETQLSGHENPSNSPAKKSMAHKRLSASVHEADRKEAVTSESFQKRSESGEKETSRVNSAVQPDEMDDEMQLNGPSPEKRIRLEKMGAEITASGSHQTPEKTKETGIDSSPVHEGSETQLGCDPSAFHEKKGIKGKELVFSKTWPSSLMDEISARKPGKASPSGTKAASPAKDISNSPSKLDANYEHNDHSQALFSQLSEASILRQPLGRAKPTPRTLKDRTNVKPVSARKVVPAWTSNVVARNFVQSVSTHSAGKKSPVKEERKPASILSASTPSVLKKPPMKEERKPAFVPSAVTLPETEATIRNTGTMQPPRNPYAVQRPFVAKASVSNLSARRASSSTLYEDSEDSYRYQEVVRCKHDRQNLPGHECPQCSNWVDSICHGQGGEVFNRKELMDCSRHRAAHSPENTPEGFWELSFADEIEARKRLNEHYAEDSESDESKEI